MSTSMNTIAVIGAVGIIYIRINELCMLKNMCKLGIASFGKNRDDTYVTYEHKRGYYILVIEIPLDRMKIIDTCLKNLLIEYNNYIDGGTEYYDTCIFDLIEPWLQLMNIQYNVLSKDEINNMERCERIRTLPNATKLALVLDNLVPEKIIAKYKRAKSNKSRVASELTQELVTNVEYVKPNPQQQYVLDLIELFYKSNDIGKIIWACGLGKALLGILIVKQMRFQSIVIGVSSKYLQTQITEEILKIFPNKMNILFVGGDDESGFNRATTTEHIHTFHNNHTNIEPIFVITTYHSGHTVVDADIAWDFKIGDEAHHLVGIEKVEERGFRLFHKIQSNKTLFMTATEKTIESRSYMDTFSMDDKKIFGECIDRKSVHWAIENKHITDYNMLVLKNTDDEIDDVINSLGIDVRNKDIFTSCYMALLALVKYADLTHLLLYTNTTEDAELSTNYIDQILSVSNLPIRKNDLYNKALHSKNCPNVDVEKRAFSNATCGIISCVFILGEGFNCTKLNGVCIAGNMQSEIRIVQYLLRPNRLEFGNPTKKAYVIIPYIDSDNWETETDSNRFDKVRNIVSQMRNVDETIEQKIMVSTGLTKHPNQNTIFNNAVNNDDYLTEDGCELDKIKLRLRYSKALGSNFTPEQDEYNYVRSLNSTLNIQSKPEYSEKQNVHSNFIESPEQYFTKNGVWENWYDFMGVNTLKFIQSKDNWINFCKEKKFNSVENYHSACAIYDILPKEPADFYKDFTNIPTELGFNRGRR